MAGFKVLSDACLICGRREVAAFLRYKKIFRLKLKRKETAVIRIEEARKISGEIKEMAVTQKQMAIALGVSAVRINQLCDEGVMVRDEFARNGQLMLFESLQNYFLSRKASGDDVNFWKEKGLHEKAKREMAELKLRERRGELYEATLIEATLAEMLANFRNKFLGLGHKLAMRLEGKTAAEICAGIDAEVITELNDLAERIVNENWTEADNSAVADAAAENDSE